MKMALLSSYSSSCSTSPHLLNNSLEATRSRNLNSFRFPSHTGTNQSSLCFISRRNRIRCKSIINCQLCTHQTLTLDRSSVSVKEAISEDELWAAACLRVRTFFASQQQPHGVHDHMRYLAEREFEALKERVAGKRIGFKRVSCINATVPLSQMTNSSDDLCSVCKGVGSDFARAYLSNVCVAKELHKNGVGSSLVAKSKKVAQEWGITDLYVHVAVDNEPARKLYLKCGFTYENDEPAWQARFLDRPRRILLWTDLSGNSNL